jgi:NADPH:quinone reductase-like Zn-dependent oxidoreductase
MSWVGGPKAHVYQALLQAILLGPVISRTGRQKMGFMGITKPNQKDLVFVKELLETGKVIPLIDRRYPLREAAEALRYLEEGHARGKVLITLEDS